MEMHDFIRACDQYHLRIRDIKDIKECDVLDVVIWDGNFEEYWIWEHANSTNGKSAYSKEGIISPTPIEYDPEEFFKENRWTVTYVKDRTWDLNNGSETFRHPIHIELEFVTESGDIRKFYTPSHNRENRCIRTNTFCENCSKIIDVPLDSLPEETRVGWRGHMILWSDLKKIDSKVYYKRGPICVPIGHEHD